MRQQKSIDISQASYHRVFTEVYIRHYDPLLHYIMRLSSDLALSEDLAQDVFVRLCERMEKFALIEDVECYLFRMARNLFISHTRRQKRKKEICREIDKQISVNITNATEEYVNQRETETLLQQAIQKLSPQCKKVYLLGKLEGIPLVKLAAILRVSPSTVKNQMVKANLQIRKYLDEKTAIEGKKKLTKGKLKKPGFSATKTLKAA